MCILQRPAATKYSNVMKKPIQDILDKIHNSHIDVIQLQLDLILKYYGLPLLDIIQEQQPKPSIYTLSGRSDTSELIHTLASDSNLVVRLSFFQEMYKIAQVKFCLCNCGGWFQCKEESNQNKCFWHRNFILRYCFTAMQYWFGGVLYFLFYSFGS